MANKTKKTLEKQLELLSERSLIKTMSFSELAMLSQAMCDLAKTIQFLSDRRLGA